MGQTPLLSICIPTYNRAQYLEKCLKAIVVQDGFNEIEVVVSDNCSTDNTPTIGEKYQEIYSNIHYFQNKSNVADMNFPLVFQRATGTLRKLTNDTVIYKKGAIEYMLKAAEENLEKKPQVYFLSNGIVGEDPKVVDSLDDYISIIKHNLTWIRSIALWEEDCEDLEIMMDHSASQMGQIPLLITNFNKRKSAAIYGKDIMGSVNVEKKDVSYGLYKVFYETFLGFIKPMVEEGEISVDTYENLRKDLLLDFFSSWVVNKEYYTDKYIFSDENLKQLLEDSYKREPYFREYKRKVNRMLLKGIIRKLMIRP